MDNMNARDIHINISDKKEIVPQNKKLDKFSPVLIKHISIISKLNMII